MPQLSLFDHGPQLLLDDASGRIAYHPGLISRATAEAWFAQLGETVDWHSERRLMYEREVDVPRLTSHYRLDDPALPSPLADAAAAVRAVVEAPFNSVGLNLYRGASDSVAPHNDTLRELAEGQPIALLSLGATRRMTIRAKQPPRRVLHIELEQGSLLVMDYVTQLHYDHGIPKQREPVAPRISLAFRVRRYPASAWGSGPR